MSESKDMSTSSSLSNENMNTQMGKKFNIPKLRSTSTNKNSSVSEYLARLREQKMKNINTTNQTDSLTVVDGLTNLKINDTKKIDSVAEDYQIDLTSALIAPGSYEREIVANVEVAPEEITDFSQFFVDCDKPVKPKSRILNDYKIDPKIGYVSKQMDTSEIRKYKSDLIAKDCSMFAKLACVRFRPYKVPPSNFRAFVKPETTIIPFDFKTMSPDEEASIIKPFVYKTAWSDNKQV